jgi:glycosyltransferase involved in cell wall biosynthesis
MKQLLFDHQAYASLQQQRAHFSERAGHSVPLKWHRFLDQWAQERLGEQISPCSLARLAGGGVLFAWLPSRDAILAAHLGRLVYLYWGGIPASGLRRAGLRSILRRARVVLVNDAVAAEEAQAFAGCRTVQVPMFIDTDFFAYASPENREPFLFCAGSNDRDPDTLVALAESGRSVVWLVNNRDLLDRYSGAHPNLRLLFHVTNEELVRLYQTCHAAIMPARRDFHAAGQTTGLEALSCGAPVVMSQGRAATIFEGVPGVRVVLQNTPEAWLEAIALLDAEPVSRVSLEQSTEWVRRHTDAESLFDRLDPLFGVDSSARGR